MIIGISIQFGLILKRLHWVANSIVNEMEPREMLKEILFIFKNKKSAYELMCHSIQD